MTTREENTLLRDTHSVSRIKSSVGKAMIRENHYTHSCHNGPMCYGLHQAESLIGVIAFATPISEAVRAKPFGLTHKDRVTELHRMWAQDGHSKNALTFFISRAFDLLLEDRPDIRCVLSFADSTEGHTGHVYRAANATYAGTTGSRALFFRDEQGALRAPRQCGENITREIGVQRGWTPEWREPKFRYLWILGPNKREKKMWTKALQWSGGYFGNRGEYVV